MEETSTSNSIAAGLALTTDWGTLSLYVNEPLPCPVALPGTPGGLEPSLQRLRENSSGLNRKATSWSSNLSTRAPRFVGLDHDVDEVRGDSVAGLGILKHQRHGADERTVDLELERLVQTRHAVRLPDDLLGLRRNLVDFAVVVGPFDPPAQDRRFLRSE